MKLLDWMQHKFRQTNNEHLTTFAPRNSSACLTDDLHYYPKSKCYPKPPRDNQFRKSFACMETARADNEQESSADLSQLFHGFLTIGTLATFEPATPTFDNIMGKETEATENELKQINNELEKALTPQGKEDHSDEHGAGAVVCPLQGYLFGSVIGLPETTTPKKEHRTSLGDLFQRSKMAEENTGPQSNNRGEKHKESVVHLMKKILKGRKLYSSSRRSIDYDKKPSKKVHPEVAPKSEHKHVTVGNFINKEYNNRNQVISEDFTSIPLVDTCKKGGNCTKNNIHTSAFHMSDSDGNRECWIKSDADYVVLEL